MLKRVGTTSDDALWADIIEEGKKPDPVKPGEKTVAELAAMWRRGERRAQALADSMVKQGRMAKRKAELPSGNDGWVYKPVKK